MITAIIERRRRQLVQPWLAGSGAVVDQEMSREAEATNAGTSDGPFVAFEEWMQVVNAELLPCIGRTERSDGFRGGLHRSDLGAFSLLNAHCSGRTAISRTPKTIRQSDPEIYLLRLQTEGTGVCTFDDGTVRLLHPGDVSLSESSRPLCHSSDSESDAFVGLVIPCRMMPLDRDRARQLTRDALPIDDGVGAMLATMLAALPTRRRQMTSRAAIRVAGVIVDLLSTTLAEQLGSERLVDPGQRDRAVLAKARAFIDTNLHLPELSVPTVAAACAVSPRQLSRLFEGEGVAAWIRNRRLERIHRDLSDPALDHLSIECIGSRHGLVHAAHTTRIFSAAYGITPGQFRRSWRDSSNQPAQDVNTED